MAHVLHNNRLFLVCSVHQHGTHDVKQKPPIGKPNVQAKRSSWLQFLHNCRFSRDVTAAMLVFRTVAKIVWGFDSIIMQNLSDILP